MLASFHAPCAVCGVASSDGLFPPAPATADIYRPAASRAPLCAAHKLQVVRGDMGFPEWCPACDAYRGDGHVHATARLA